MNKNLKRLNKIQRLIPIDKFYSVTITAEKITLQGDFDQDFLIYLAKWFKFKSGNGSIKSNVKNNIQITFL